MEGFEFEDGSVHLQLYVPAPEVPEESGGLGQPSDSGPAAEDNRGSAAAISMGEMVHLRMTLPFQVDDQGRYTPYDGYVVFLGSEDAAITEDVEDEDGDSNPEAVAVKVRLDSLCRLDDHTTPIELLYNPQLGDYEDMDGGRLRWATKFHPLTPGSPFVSSCPEAARDILTSLIDFTSTKMGACFSLRGVEYPSKATLEASVYHDYDPSVAVVWRYRSKDEGTAPDEPTLDVRYQASQRDDYEAAEGAAEVPENAQESTALVQEAAGGLTEHEDPEDPQEAVVPVLLRFLRKQDTWTYQGREGEESV